MLHWDFLLEAEDVLRAWRLLSEPARGSSIVAEPLPNHRLIYLNYEGPVAGDRGAVSQWDSGSFAWECAEPNEIRVRLRGNQISGPVKLSRNDDGEWSWRWSD